MLKEAIKMIISFSGLDGSGKTTHTRLTSEYLSNQGIKTIDIHLQKFSIFGKLSKILMKISPRNEKKIKGLEYSQEKKSKWLISILRKVTYILDISRFYVIKSLNKNKVIICDRYFYDLLTQSQYFNLFGPKFSKFFLKIIPKSELPFFLSTDTDTASKRVVKDSFQDTSFFKKKLELYSKLDINFIVINSDTIENKQKIIEKVIVEKTLKLKKQIN